MLLVVHRGEKIKKILKPGFRYSYCENKDCNKRYETAKTYTNIADKVCSAHCHFIVKARVKNKIIFDRLKIK